MSSRDKTIRELILAHMDLDEVVAEGGKLFDGEQAEYKAIAAIVEEAVRRAAWKALQLSYLKRDPSDGAMFQAQSWCDQAVAAVMGESNE